MEAKKNPKAELDNKRSVFFQLGLVITLTAVFYAFEWKTYSFEKRQYEEKAFSVELEDDLIPLIVKVNIPTPPPPKAVKSKLPPKIVEIRKIKKLQMPVERPKKTQTVFFEEEKTIEEYIPYGVKARMPVFPGCETEVSEELKRSCSYKQLMNFIAKEINYPPMLKDAGIEGKVYMEFVINKSGKVDNIKILKGVDGAEEFTKESIRALRELPGFSPAVQQGRAVSVVYTIPISFSLK